MSNQPNRNTLRLDASLVRSLREAQNEFLQVLLPRFLLRRNRNKGIELSVSFDFDSPVVWRRLGKVHIHERLNKNKVKAYQEKFEAILLRNENIGSPHSDPGFPFRFGNGGTLPVIRRGAIDYYCLFYRELKPVGWNIANGGADSLEELLDPVANIERELREELIIVEPNSARRYIFSWDEGQPSDHPDFAIARRVWKEVFQRRNFPELEAVTIPLKWLLGSDSVRISFAGREPVCVDGIILNINAEDFSIETDRVAKLEIGSDAVLCDGEVVRGQLLDRPIGLFEVQKFNASLAAGQEDFKPDLIFRSGRNQTAHGTRKVVEDYIRSLVKRKLWAPDVASGYRQQVKRYGLCPVTRNVIKRYLILSNRGEPHSTAGAQGRLDAFISSASQDCELGSKVFNFLQAKGFRTFFSDQTLHDSNYGSAIDEALDSARAMVVVGTKLDHFLKPWVEFEWRGFHNDILSGRKPKNTPLVTIAAGVDPQVLPKALGFRQVFSCRPSRPEAVLRKLPAFLRRG